MKKVVVHVRREGPKLHPWLFFAASVLAAGIVIALVAYVVIGRETPDRKAKRLTEELVASIGRRDWRSVQQKMRVPEGVDAARFEEWARERYKILPDQDPILLSKEVGEPAQTGEGTYEVHYGLTFRFKRTDRRSNPEGVAKWRYNVQSGSMNYVMDDEAKEALGID